MAIRLCSRRHLRLATTGSLLLLLACCRPVEGGLHGALAAVQFYHAELTSSADRLVDLPMAVSYMEPDNITCAQCGWAVHSGWTYPWVANGSNHSPSCTPSVKGADQDSPGNDLAQLSVGSLAECQHACCASLSCNAWLYEAQTDAQGKGCSRGRPCCFLKTQLGQLVPKKLPGGSTIGTLGRAPPAVRPPGMGIRSAPALGGVGAGSVELRADGSFREWTILNQGPGGSGKFGLVDDVWMAARWGQNAARVLRTHPPAGLPGVAGLEFSGSYPVTRLALADPALPRMAVHGYSTFKPTALAESAAPAIVLTLSVAAEESGTASFLLQMPMAAMTDCARTDPAASVANTSDYAGCLHACHNSSSCQSWQWTASSGQCAMNPSIPLTHHLTGAYCGVRGSGWTASASGLTLDMHPNSTAGGPSVGDITLLPVADAVANVSYGVSDNPANLFDAFSRSGSLGQGAISSTVAAHGAAAVSIPVRAGQNVSISIVFAWHFPDRDFNGNIYGNMYANLWPDSRAVASSLGNESRLAQVVQDINTHHSTVGAAGNPAPSWLKDMLLNQFSHYHMMVPVALARRLTPALQMWYRDGRIREYEAWSCPDVSLCCFAG